MCSGRFCIWRVLWVMKGLILYLIHCAITIHHSNGGSCFGGSVLKRFALKGFSEKVLCLSLISSLCSVQFTLTQL